MTFNFPWKSFNDIKFNTGELFHSSFNSHVKKLYDNGYALNINPRISSASTSGYGIASIATSAEVVAGTINNKVITTDSLSGIKADIDIIEHYNTLDSVNITRSTRYIHGEFTTSGGSTAPYVYEVDFGENSFYSDPVFFTVSPICSTAPLCGENIACYRYIGQNDSTNFSVISSQVADYTAYSDKAIIVYYNPNNSISKITWAAIGYDEANELPPGTLPVPVSYVFIGAYNGSLDSLRNYSPRGVPRTLDDVTLFDTATNSPSTGTITCSSLLNMGGDIYGGIYNCTTSGNSLGTIHFDPSNCLPPIFNGAVSGNNLIIDSGNFYSTAVFVSDVGIFSGIVTNNANIYNGTFRGHITNNGIIYGGTYAETVNNYDIIKGGTYNDIVSGDNTGIIIYDPDSVPAPVFNDSVYNNSLVVSSGIFNCSTTFTNMSGTFDKDVVNNAIIKTGDFYGAVSNNNIISGGTYNDLVTNNGILSGGTYNDIVNNNTNVHGGTYNDLVTNNGNIRNGIFNSTVDNNSIISGGTYNDVVSGDNTGTIIYNIVANPIPIFNSTVSVNTVTIETGDFNGYSTFIGTSGVFGNTVTNYGAISAGNFDGIVTNNNMISGGMFNNDVTNTATLSGGIYNANVGNLSYIKNGTFNALVTNDHYINDGDFNSIVINNAYISSGTFNDRVTNEWNISGGIFSGGVKNNKHIYNGTFNSAVTGYDWVYSKDFIYGGTFNDRVFDTSSIYGGTFNCPVEQVINVFDGTFNGEVYNIETSQGGVFNGDVYFQGSTIYTPIYGGTFNGNTYTKLHTVIGGTFSGPTSFGGCVFGPYNFSPYSGGTYNDVVSLLNIADTYPIVIYGGTYNYPVLNKSSEYFHQISIYGGTYNDAVSTPIDKTNMSIIYHPTYSHVTPIFSGTTYNIPLTISSGILNAYNMFPGTSGIFNQNVTNNSAISGGVFDGIVTNTGIIYNGTFNNLVINNGGTLIGGIFNDNVSGNNTGYIVYNPDDMTPPVFNDSVYNNSLIVSSGSLNAYDTFIGQSGTFSGNVTNYANISAGIFTGIVTNTAPASFSVAASAVSAIFIPTTSAAWQYPSNSGTITNADIYWLSGDNTLGGTITYANYLGYPS